METGRFKVFEHLNDWFEEFRLYHRKDGKVVKEGDDLMAATRYALMMLRFARTQQRTTISPPHSNIRNWHRMRRLVVWNTMKNEFGSSSWAVDDGIVTVVTAEGTKSAQLGGVPPDILVRCLMWENTAGAKPWLMRTFGASPP